MKKSRRGPSGKRKQLTFSRERLFGEKGPEKNVEDEKN